MFQQAFSLWRYLSDFPNRRFDITLQVVATLEAIQVRAVVTCLEPATQKNNLHWGNVTSEFGCIHIKTLKITIENLESIVSVLSLNHSICGPDY
jgi:hypothetical protein